jgi:hypothetical protein
MLNDPASEWPPALPMSATVDTGWLLRQFRAVGAWPDAAGLARSAGDGDLRRHRGGRRDRQVRHGGHRRSGAPSPAAGGDNAQDLTGLAGGGFPAAS